VKPPRALTILQVIPRLEAGGVELNCIDLVRGLVAAGHRALVAAAPGRLVPDLEKAGGIFVPFDGTTKNPLKIVTNGLWLARLAASEGVDIIHARSRAPAWSARLASHRSNRPFVTTYHGIYNENSSPKRWYNSVMASGDRVIANSAFTAQTVRTRYGTDLTRLTTIFEGIDEEKFDPGHLKDGATAAMRQDWGVGKGQLVILLGARFTDWKGHGILLEAAAILRKKFRPPFAVVLLGTGANGTDYAKQLKARAHELGVQDIVRFRGNTDNMAAAYAAADVTVSASTRAESFGRTLVEAQAMGCPIVASLLGPIPETVLAPPLVDDAKRTGWIFPPADPAAMAQALEAALGLNAGQRQIMAKNARAHVLENFTTGAMIHATIKMYLELAGKRVAPPAP